MLCLFRRDSSEDEDEYVLLAHDDSSGRPRQRPRKRQAPRCLRRQHTQIALTAMSLFTMAVCSWLWLFFHGRIGIPSPILHALAKESRLPPLYSRFHEYERHLPQHSLSHSPENQEVRYIWMANYMRANGWGNVMEELLLNSFLAYRAGRSFVFTNFTWNEGVSDYSLYNLKPIPSRIPLTALIRGPTVGGEFPAGDNAPLAVMKDFWDQVCPGPKVIRDDDILSSFGDQVPTAETKIGKWLEVLNRTDDRCVEIPRESWVIFDIWIMQDAKRLLDVWPSFSQSPILTTFAWSALVELAFDTNREVFSPSMVLDPFLSSVPVTVPSAERYSPIPGLLAVHIRRGDFVRHCKRLTGWGASFVGFNSFPSMLDQLNLPPDTIAESRAEFYRLRCYPEIDEIVAKVEEVRRTEAGKGLENVYIMTNAPTEWIFDLKASLRRAGQWSNIASSRDLILNQEQEYVKQAVDMLIGQRAQVFVGNGFSTMTGQVTMLRMANRFPPETSRLW
ncbi:hypothetical protein WOLCODRAFT_108243 [Wolfiporia cocos MD-104 SS10]|uniref:Uncharacterized protein n=1 Tax=Wolfiporia cocos (strain MD-104) TaxID=742152 RepID=A0A2H3J1Q9_WOLCO|nr:hypothetical protein WOLCODRAFT_108243 [Wolfiporia cocos MD-104 SS10]